MDMERARELAVAEFAGRLGGGWNQAWELAGSRQDSVRTLDGVKTHIVFDFAPRDMTDHGALRTLSIAVDPQTGIADMLR
ncbi:hypothetical protein ACGFIK_20655 [Micromonospora sp. NPDC048871]|uniref:hypothetical protein n=1 Tax=unclassified Micromonospora TaxID=2617518 RepID=UPI002E14A7FF|nr:hypothetical protein OIE53_25490 [Micromonospora sp. NBC_01739]